jgi:hypothetical protein
MSKQPPKPTRKPRKAGRPADRLVITDDPQTALNKLLKKKPAN